MDWASARCARRNHWARLPSGTRHSKTSPNSRRGDLAKGDPVISVDTQKKELIGNFAREGHTHTQAPVEVRDHDFPSAGEGKLIAHGIDGLAHNEGDIHLNTRCATREWCCDSIGP